MENVYVNPAGDWKLGGLEFLSKTSEDLFLLKNLNQNIGDKFFPPEFQSNNGSNPNFLETLQKHKFHTFDCWLLGCFIIHIFTGDFQGPQSTRVIKELPKVNTPNFLAYKTFFKFQKKGIGE